MTALTDSRPLAEALRTTIEAQLGGWQVFDYGRVPGDVNNPDEVERNLPMPEIFALLSLERRSNAQTRASARTSRTGWRFTIRVVGSTPNEARWALAKAAAAVNEVRLAVGDATTTPIQFERDQAPELDEGHFSALSSWTFAI